MYAIETAKKSSKGQLVVPDAFRRRYGWRQGMTLMSAHAVSTVRARVKRARRSFDKLGFVWNFASA